MSVHKNESEKRIKCYSKVKYTGRLLKVGIFFTHGGFKFFCSDSSLFRHLRFSRAYVMVADIHQQRKYFPCHIIFVLFILWYLNWKKNSWKWINEWRGLWMLVGIKLNKNNFSTITSIKCRKFKDDFIFTHVIFIIFYCWGKTCFEWSVY